jgi:hypothetical protein
LDNANVGTYASIIKPVECRICGKVPLRMPSFLFHRTESGFCGIVLFIEAAEEIASGDKDSSGICDMSSE